MLPRPTDRTGLSRVWLPGQTVARLMPAELVSGVEAFRASSRDMNTQDIGAAGELLVQYELLKLGIDSPRLTTDAGVDPVPATHGLG